MVGAWVGSAFLGFVWDFIIDVLRRQANDFNRRGSPFCFERMYLYCRA
jgi:hypothetical protein